MNDLEYMAAFISFIILIMLVIIVVYFSQKTVEESLSFTQQSNQATSVVGLDKIRQTHKITIGYQPGLMPLSDKISTQNEPLGYSIDIDKIVVQAIKTQLRDPNLAVEYQPLSIPQTIPAIQQGKVDFACNIVNTYDRQSQVHFSLGYFPVTRSLMVNEHSEIKDFDDMNGKNIGVTKGSTSEKRLADTLIIKGVHAAVMPFNNFTELTKALESGQIDAISSDEILLKMQMATFANQHKWRMIHTATSYDVYACAVPSYDNDFAQVINGALRSAFQSGEIERIYHRWFLSPLPDLGINLNIPMSKQMRNLISNPNNVPVPDITIQMKNEIRNAFNNANNSHRNANNGK